MDNAGLDRRSMCCSIRSISARPICDKPAHNVTMTIDLADRRLIRCRRVDSGIQTELRKGKQAATSYTPVTFLWQPNTTNALTFDLLPDLAGECGYLQATQRSSHGP